MNQLQTLRDKFKMTLKQVGEFVGSYDKTVWLWEQGQSFPSGEAVVKLYRLYGEPVIDALEAQLAAKEAGK